MKLQRHAWLIAVGGAAMFALAASTLRRVEPRAGPCSIASGPDRFAELSEASGLAVSRRHAGILWSHNDSGNDAVLFAIDVTGAVRARVRLPITTRDWEAIAAARCGDADCLYVGDIGDNRAVRPNVSIYRVPEPALQDSTTPEPRVFTMRYPDGPHNAESMFIAGHDLFIVTRDQLGLVYRAPLPAESGDYVLTRVGTLGLAALSDAGTSTDGATVIVRNSHEAVLYRTTDVIAGRFAPYRRIPLEGLREPQGEGIALDGSTLYLASEGGMWSNAGQLVALRCDFSAPPATGAR